jgi:Flp pilus assembly protein TadD
MAVGLAVVGASLLAIGCAFVPRDAPALKELAREDFAAGRTADALNALRSATALAPEDAEAHYLLGVVALRSENLEEAAAALDRARQLDPRDARTLAAHGLVLRAQKRWAEAESALLRSLLLRPGDSSTIVALGEVYRLSGQADRCAARYEQFVWQLEQIDPKTLDALQQRALATARDRVRECEAAATAQR